MPSQILAIVKENTPEVITLWEEEQHRHLRDDQISSTEAKEQMEEFLKLFCQALGEKHSIRIRDPEWRPVREFLTTLSQERSVKGFSPTETVTFILSLKKVLLQILFRERKGEVALDQISKISDLVDRLGLFITEVHQNAREEVIARQNQDMLELSTPVVKLSPGIIALPMIGTLDSNRSEIVMETLLERIVETGAEIAIIDITGVPTVDSLVAQHLLKTVTAARLMGAECIISGVKPQIASTIVHLGVELGEVTTKASLSSALELAFSKSGYRLVKTDGHTDK